MFKKYDQPFDLDDPRTTLARREIILNKPFIKKLYDEWYGVIIKVAKSVGKGKYVEIGSGGGFLKDVFPEAITSDILELPTVDKVFSAEELPFKENELGCIMMINVFHHIPKPYLFLKEAERTLLKGGKVVMIEPGNTLFGRFVYQNFHHEPFDPKGPREIKAGSPLSHSNQALPHIYFERDKELFEKEFPHLKIVSIKYHTALIGIFSGGVTRTAMLPNFMYPVVRAAEWVLSPFAKLLALNCTVILEKK